MIVVFFRFVQYLNSEIKVKLPFAKKNISKFFTLFSKSGSCALPFDFKLERGPKNIFYYQYEVESYTGLVLDFSLFDKREYTHGIFRSAILANMFTLGVYLMFSLFLKI